MTRPIDVTVVVVSFNSAAVLPGLIASLSVGLRGLEWRLVVADNASTDGSRELISSLDSDAVVLDLGRNAGYAGGINAAVLTATRLGWESRSYLIVNPDVRLMPACVSILLAALNRPGVGVAVPRLDDAAGELILSIRREPTFLRALGDALFGAERAGRSARLGEIASDPRHYRSAAAIDWAEGSTQLVSAACWETSGPWDETFFLYSEEADFDLRAGDHGWEIRYVPEARAVHLEGGSATSPQLWPLVVTNRVRLYRRRHGSIATGFFWAAVLLREVSRSLLGRQTSRRAVRALVDLRRLREAPGPHSISGDA